MWRAPRAPPHSPARSARPSPPRSCARPGRRPRRRAAMDRRGRRPPPRRRGRGVPRSGRRGWARLGGRAPRPAPGRGTSASVGSAPARRVACPGAARSAAPRPRRAGRRSARGAVAANRPPGCSPSRRRRRACCAPRPARRCARAGRTDVGVQPDEAGPMLFGDRLGARRVVRGVVDDDARQAPEGAEHTLELRGPITHGHDHGDVGGVQRARPGPRDETSAVTKSRARGGPASAHRPGGRPSIDPPGHCPASRCGSRRRGLPPTRTRPPSTATVDRSSSRRKEPGTGVEGGGGACWSGEGLPGALRTEHGHGQSLAVQGRG